jgi:hypothetical protein
LFLPTAFGHTFFDIEKENLLGSEFLVGLVGATYNNRTGELYLFPFLRIYGKSFLAILLFLGSIM